MMMQLVTCPLCCRPGFNSSDSLSAALLEVTTKRICCPICQELIHGLDKFTIHLFSHSLAKITGSCSKQNLKETPPIPSTKNQILTGFPEFSEVSFNEYVKSTHSQSSAPNLICNDASYKTAFRRKDLEPFELAPSSTTGDLKSLDNKEVCETRSNSSSVSSGNVSSCNKTLPTLTKLQVRDENSTDSILKVSKVVGNSAKETSLQLSRSATPYFLQSQRTGIHSGVCSNIPVSENSLIYVHTDNGQIFALSQENLKTVTINTQNFITNTSIMTTPNVSSGNNKTMNRDLIDCNQFIKHFDSGSKSTPKEVVIPTDKSENPIETFEGKVKLNDTEFESCRDLITKGDFSTAIDDLIDLTNKSSSAINDPGGGLSGPRKELSSNDGTNCDICKYIFPNKTLLAMHIQIVHRKTEPTESDNKRKTFMCTMCPKTFKMRGSLMLHRRVAHFDGNSEIYKEPPPKPACTVCGKFFKKEMHLTQHMRAHEARQWQCSICSKKFSTKYFLKKHRRLHTGETPYTCPKCGKSFTFQQSFNRHMAYHTNEKPYCCSHCGRLFKELSTLHNHERIHSGEKPFSCDICGKSFRQRVSYLVHSRIHTGVMPYKCTACNKNFRYKVTGRSHKCTCDPPGTIVRLEGNLVERLTAAMFKAADKFDKRGNEVFSPITSPSSSSISSVVSTLSPASSLGRTDMSSQEIVSHEKVSKATCDLKMRTFTLLDENVITGNQVTTLRESNGNESHNYSCDSLTESDGNTSSGKVIGSKIDISTDGGKNNLSDHTSKYSVSLDTLNDFLNDLIVHPKEQNKTEKVEKKCGNSPDRLMDSCDLVSYLTNNSKTNTSTDELHNQSWNWSQTEKFDLFPIASIEQDVEIEGGSVLQDINDDTLNEFLFPFASNQKNSL